MLNYTFDRSPELGLALVATANMGNPHYETLDIAPAHRRDAAAPYLRQMHTVANGVMSGLVAQQRRPLVAAEWEQMGSCSAR